MEKLKKMLANGGWVYPFCIVMFMGFPAFLILGLLGESLGEPYKQPFISTGAFIWLQTYFCLPVAIVGLVNRAHWCKDKRPWQHRNLAMYTAVSLWLLVNLKVFSSSGENHTFWFIVIMTFVVTSLFGTIAAVAYCGQHEEV